MSVSKGPINTKYVSSLHLNIEKIDFIENVLTHLLSIE